MSTSLGHGEERSVVAPGARRTGERALESLRLLPASGDELVARAARLAVERIGDACVVRVDDLEPAGLARSVTSAANDLGRTSLEALARRIGGDAAEALAPIEAGAGGALVELAAPPEGLRVVERVLARLAAESGFLSLLAAPIEARGVRLGMLFVLRASSAADGEDLADVRELARRLGAALDGVRASMARASARSAADILHKDRRARVRAWVLARASAELASSLDYATTLHRVARIVVPEVAAGCAIDLVGEAGAIQRAVLAHEDPEREGALGAFLHEGPLDPTVDHPIAVAIARGSGERVRDVREEDHARFARGHGGQSRGAPFFPSAYVVVPLRARGRTIGALTLVAEGEGRSFDDEDFALALALAERVGHAVDGAMLYRAEQRARRAAELGAERIARLHALTIACGSAKTLEAAMRTVVAQATDAMQASAGAIARVEADPSRLELAAVRGTPHAVVEAVGRLPPGTPTPWGEAVATRAPIFIERGEELRRRYPALAAIGSEQGACAALPLVRGGRLLGALCLSFAEPRVFVADERFFLLAMANESAQAIEAVRLYEAECRARAAAQAAERRAAFLANASEVLSSSLDYRTTLAAVARLAVPELADGCLVDLVEPDGRTLRVAAAHAQPENTALTGVFHTLLAGESVPSDVPILGLGDGRSHMLVPLVARDRTLGAMVFVADAPRRYGPAEVDLARQLARRAAIAVDNARLYEEAQRAIHAREEALATVSHDLKNPLAAIAASAGTIKKLHARSEIVDACIRAADVILRSVARMDALIRDLLDLARFEAGRVPLDARPSDLGPVVADACELLRPLAAEKRVELELAIDGPLPQVVCDVERVQQVLSNLVGNAVKFSPHGARVSVAARARGGEVEVLVADAGAGIAAMHLAHVFDRFWQAPCDEAARATRSNGSGLGLAIAKAIVEAHGGRIWAESAVGVGSTFAFALPAVAH